MTDPLELELKLEFEAVDSEKLKMSEPLASAGHETRRLVSTYFDTPDWDLHRAGYSLRVRKSDRQRIQTVKVDRGLSAGLFARSEWERRLTSDAPLLDKASGPLVEALGTEALTRIEPIFVTDVRRTSWSIEQAGNALEIAIDDGEVRAGKRVEPIGEIEFELQGGSPQALFDLARQVNERVPLRLGVRSKAERGYALAAGAPPEPVKAEPVTLDSKGDAADAFVIIVQGCLRQFRLNEALLLQTGAAEPLHQARVGLRRLRSAFSLYKPLLTDDRQAALLSVELRWLAAELGEVRNIDVLIERCAGDAHQELVLARQRTFEHVRGELASARTRLLMIDLAEWLAVGAWRTAPAHPARLHQDLIPFARNLLETRRDRLERRGKGLAGLDRERRHRVRIEAKKLRYATEFFASLYANRKARRQHKGFLDALEALQDLLGELNDLVVGPAVLAKLGIDATLPKSGKHERARLLDKAEDAYDSLMRAKRFWRV